MGTWPGAGGASGRVTVAAGAPMSGCFPLPGPPVWYFLLLGQTLIHGIYSFTDGKMVDSSFLLHPSTPLTQSRVRKRQGKLC